MRRCARPSSALPTPRMRRQELPRMPVELSADLAELRPEIRRFVEQRLEPIAEEIDRTGAIPDSAWSLMREQGWLGMLLPAEAGGGGVDLPTYCLVMEEVARSHRVFTL